ncbi:MAG TPA: hypothetical protein EYQ09_06995 [Flavobacteriales bacterium]|jgi:hypothetical protein|nr:hypothetical protein [Flavobacteriales bacterium]HIK87010.1 hypothetical protein [Alphaproteobacteria bacterium]
MQNFIAQSMRRMGLAPKNKSAASSVSPSRLNNSNAPLAHMDVGSKWSYSTLEYPMDIQSRTDLGHYMMFYINVPNNTEFGRKGGVGDKKNYVLDDSGDEDLGSRSLQQQQIMGDAKISTKSKDGHYDVNGQSWKPGTPNKVIDRPSHQGTAANTLGQQRTQRTTDSIVLYMPPALTTNYASAYKSNELGGELGESAGRINSFMDRAALVGEVTAAKEAVSGVAGQAARMIERAGAKMLSGIVGGDALGAFDKISNRAMNNFLETTFTGVDFRKFSYSWKFAPKNVDEVFMVEKIIRLFKFHMLPELPQDTLFGRYYVVPSEFDLFYMFRGDENTWMNKIQTSVLVNMEVNYTPNQYTTFRPIQGRNGAPPTEIDMKLDFQETKIITKKEVQEGY